MERVDKYYFLDGTTRSKWRFENGKLNGESVCYYNNGRINFIYTYKDDLVHGKCVFGSEGDDILKITYILYREVVTEEEFRKHELTEKLSGI